MSLFNRKTFLDGDGFRHVNNISLGINDIVNVGTLGLVPDITGEDAAQAAADAGTAANRAAQEKLDAQYAQTRSDLLPFLEAATGEGGALSQYQTGINQQPTAPTLQNFNFDVGQAMTSPELAWQQEMGQQQLDRTTALNKKLGSGNRLYDVTRFGQGLAAQSLDDQYNRQANTYGMNQNTALKNYSLGNDQYNSRMNRLAGLIDVGRGSGSAMGSMGAQNASSIAGLLNNTGQLRGAAEMAGYNGMNNILNMGASTLGTIYGGPIGGAAASNLFGGSAPAASYGYSPIGAQDAKGFF